MSNLYCKEYQAARARLLAKNGYECERCGLNTPHIQAHHLHYGSHYDLIMLCPECHWIADRIRKIDYSILEKSASVNWHCFKEWMAKNRIGWFSFGERQIVKVVYQACLIREKCTVGDVTSGAQIEVLQVYRIGSNA